MNSSPEWVSNLGRETQETIVKDDTCCSSSECVEAFTTGRPPITRIAITSADARFIEPYLATYASYLENSGGKALTIQLNELPSTQELFKDIRFDIKSRSGLYDGFIIPPILMGDLLALGGIAPLSLSKSGGISGNLAEFWNDLLPYYKEHISTLDGQIRGVPLLAGNQPLLLYRKDYLEALNLSVPVTWGDYVRVASVLHNQTVAPDGSAIFGSCLGRMSQAMCRRHQMNSEEGWNCTSMSTPYLGMILASMTQNQGSSTGWLFDNKPNATMAPLLNEAFESTLVFLEQQLKFGAPDELNSDSSINLDLFRMGYCAMTIVVDHPPEVLNSTNVGFAPIPGAHVFLDRGNGTMVKCTEESCPYGEWDAEWGIVNRAPYGADDMMVGAISTFASSAAKDELYDFFSFIAQVRQGLDVAGESEQPITYSSLDTWGVDGYSDVILGLTESNNTAAPLRIPNSFSLLSELDNQVYDYLVAGDFTNETRRRVRERVEASLQRMILQYDAIYRVGPTSLFYEKSLGAFRPANSPDLYIERSARVIGWSLGGISCCCSLFFAFWVWRNKDSSVVRGSQEMFLNLLCWGTLLMACCIFLFGVEDDITSTEFAGRACMGSMWLYSIGYVIIITALSSKIWLINRIFRKVKNLQRIRIGWVDILWPFWTLGGVNIVTLITWNIHDPAAWHRIPIEEMTFSGDFEEVATFGTCDSEYFRVYFGMLVAANYLFSVVALVQAYECRKISTDYLESIWISASLGCIVQVWTVGLPLLKLVDNNPRRLFLVKAIVVFLTTMCPLLLIFLPKLGYAREARWNAARHPDPAAGPLGVSGDGHSLTSSDSDFTRERANFAKSSGLSSAMAAGVVSPDGKWRHPGGPKGIRIIQTSNPRHVEEVENLQRTLRHAESRHQSLAERLERLQEKLEVYIISRHPHMDFHDSARSGNNFILAARSENVVLPAVTKTHPKT